MRVNVKPGRKVFAAALALFLLWVGALATLAVISASRPSNAKIRTATDPTPPDSKSADE